MNFYNFVMANDLEDIKKNQNKYKFNKKNS